MSDLQSFIWVQHLRYAVDYRRRAHPREHPQRAMAECHLARAYAALGRETEARALLTTCLPRIARYALLELSLRRAAVALNANLQ